MNFTPDGRRFGKDKNVTDEIDDKGGGMIFAMKKFLVCPLVDNMKAFAEKKKYFLIAMDNNFTLKKLLTVLQEFVLGVVGTARFCPGWPGQNCKEIENSQTNCNEIVWSVGSFGTLLLRWMGNELVLLVTTVHNMMYVKMS